MTVTLAVPGALAAEAGGTRELTINTGDTTIANLFDQIRTNHPVLERRIRDEKSAIRRHVNIYVDGTDIRTLSGVETPVPNGATVQIIAAVSGG